MTNKKQVKKARKSEKNASSSGTRMKIKKQIKRENARNKRTIIFSLIIMASMSYLVVSLNNDGLFSGWEIYFAYGYLILINILLLINILKVISKNRFLFEISGDRVKIKDGMFKAPLSIMLDRIRYVDVYEKDMEDFEVLIVIERGKRNKAFQSFDRNFVKSNPHYGKVLNNLEELYPDNKFYCYVMKKAGAMKYLYLYMLYKSCYEAKFSSLSMDYIRRFVEEYIDNHI